MAASAQLAVKTASGLWIRPEPVRISWLLADLVASDGHRVRCTISMALRALDQPAEIQMLTEALMGSAASVTAEMAQKHFEPSLRSAVAETVARLTGDACVSPDGRTAAAEAAIAAARRIAFGCGIEILPPCQAEIESPTLAQQRLQAMQSEAAKQRMAEQAEHLERAADLLKRFDQIRQSSPELAASRILEQFDITDRGSMLQTLMMASAQQKQTDRIWAVAGASLVEIDRRPGAGAARAHALTAELGPLRSINTHGDDQLLVGARGGVLAVDAASPSQAECYADRGVVSQMGFSQALWWGEQLWSCHSEAGIVGWNRGHTREPLSALRPVELGGASPRNLAVLDDIRLVFSSGPRLMVLQRESEAKLTATKVGEDAPAEIVALLPAGDALIAMLRDGVMRQYDRTTLELSGERALAGSVAAATLMPWMGEQRLLLAEESGPVLCIGLADGMVTQFASMYRGLKVITAAADIIAAVTGDRQRVIWWETWTPGSPAGDVYITAMTKHRAGDVAV